MTPIKDPAVKARIREILTIMRRDDRRAWRLGSDGLWARVQPVLEDEPQVDTFEALMGLAVASAPQVS